MGSSLSKNRDQDDLNDFIHPNREPTKIKQVTADTSPAALEGGGFKNDNGKTRLELLPPEFLFATATILGFGAVKYPYRNWEKGMSWGRVFGALMRHLWAWWGGSQKTKTNFAFGDLDIETGCSHLWHASCCMAFLVTYEEREIGEDDRPSTTMEPSYTKRKE